MKAIFLNPAGRRRRARRPVRRKAARKSVRVSTVKRRRRSSGRRRSSRRRVYRNPSFGGITKGLDIQGALLAVAGAAGAKFLVNKMNIADPKMKAGATLAAGVAMGMLPIGPMRSKLALGGQIAGISMLLNEFMPGTFADDAGVYAAEDTGVFQGLSVEPAAGSGW